MINGIHHMAISTPNLDRLSDFYRQAFGFQIVDRLEWPQGSAAVDSVVGLRKSAARSVMMKASNCFIELFEFSAPMPKPAEARRPVCDHGYTHFCLDVTNIVEEYERLKKVGATFHTEPVIFEQAGVASTYGRDPDGNAFEIQEIFAASHRFHFSRTGSGA